MIELNCDLWYKTHCFLYIWSDLYRVDQALPSPLYFEKDKNRYKLASEATLIILCHAFAKNIDCTLYISTLFLNRGKIIILSFCRFVKLRVYHCIQCYIYKILRISIISLIHARSFCYKSKLILSKYRISNNNTKSRL